MEPLVELMRLSAFTSIRSGKADRLPTAEQDCPLASMQDRAPERIYWYSLESTALSGTA